MCTNQTEDRARVLSDLNVNMVVEAGAGTGKTTLLIKRICLAVLAQGVPIDKIVALTFTEKAAAEIKTRLVGALHRFVRDISALQEGQILEEESLLYFIQQHFELGKDVLVTRAQQALMRLDRASIGTIHGFCADILRTFPLEAGLSPKAEIDSGAKGEHLFNARWNSFLDAELGLNAPRKEIWKRVLAEISLPDLKDFAQGLCRGKIEKYDYFSHAEMLATVCEEKAIQAHAWSTAYLNPKRPKPRSIENALIWAEQMLLATAQCLRAKSFTSQTDTPMPSVPSDPPVGWEEDAFEQACCLVQYASKMRPYGQYLFRQALALVEELVAQIRADYAREGILSFDDLIVKTRKLVQQNLNVRRMLKEKLDILFIDEFQDTDPVQGELLLFLAEEKSGTATRWQDVKLSAGKLIVVGDPKQSIYRFRGADITAYELFTRLILAQKGVKCFLRQNYRSVPAIVEVANKVCSQAMVHQTAFQPAYEAIVPTKSPQQKAVEWIFVKSPQTGTASVDDYRDNQAEQIATWINQHVGKATLANGEKLTYKDIAILTRVNTTISPYTEALRRHGIPFSTDNEKDFFKRPEINDFLNFLRVMVDPSDTISLVGVLRSPLGGFTDEEIYQFSVRGELSIYAQTKDEKLARLYKLLLSFASQVGRSSVPDFLEQVWYKTDLPQLCAAAYDGEQTWALLKHLTQQTQNLLGEAPATLGQFLATLEDILETSPDTLNAVPNDVTDTVSVMTVHKSKGLDFPVVIWADLSKKEGAGPTTSSKHLFSWQYDMHGLRVGKFCDANLAFLEEEQKKHERCEEIRILYVALTRAKEKLVLVADARKSVSESAQAFKQVGLWPEEKEVSVDTSDLKIPARMISYEDPTGFIYRTQDSPKAIVHRLNLTDWRKAFNARKARYEKLLAEESLSPSARVDNASTLAPEQQVAAEVGSACHRALQLMLTNKELSAREAAYQATQQLNFTTSESVVAKLLLEFSQSNLFKELTECKLLAAEMPFSYQTQNGLVETGIMDGVLERTDGSIWVIDYKTDHIPTAGPQALLEKYRPQLSAYQSAAKQIFPTQKVRCSVILVRTFAVLDL